jgi:hypothetical protein
VTAQTRSTPRLRDRGGGAQPTPAAQAGVDPECRPHSETRRRRTRLIGFAGNELVAVYRIRVGRQIGSAALEADGYHARTDGFTSLAVSLGRGRRVARVRAG